MLDTFFEERAGSSLLAATSEPAALAVHARAMHKLKGAAAAIGAKHLKALAAEAEAACCAGKADDAAALAERMSAEIQRIERSADANRVSVRAA